MNKLFLIASFFIFSFSFAQAQDNIFLNQEYSGYAEKALNRTNVSIHTGFKPLIRSQMSSPERFYYDSVATAGSGPFYLIYDSNSSAGSGIYAEHYHIVKLIHKSWLYRKLYYQNLFFVEDTSKKFWATIDPLFNFQGTDDRGDSAKKFYQNTRGLLIQGGIGGKFSFSSSFLENQADYPAYIKSFVDGTGVVPGSGRTKTFGKGGYDFSMSSGYISYAPCKHVNIQLGHGKNFIGDGYRSLLLSDNSFNYPYLRVTTTFGKFQYTNMYAIFMNLFNAREVLDIATEGIFQRKAASFQYLSWTPISRLELGIFQGMIWQASDSTNHQSYNFYYFNPVIGVSAVKYGLSNTNNVLMGSTIKYKVCNNLMAYGQLVVDDNGAMKSVYDKTGYQLGLKYYNNKGQVMLEYNQVRPYTYSASDPVQSYSHYDQPLADPMGANFKEVIGIINYRFSNRFAIHLQMNYTLSGLSSGTFNAGDNIFASDAVNSGVSNTLLQGVRATILYADAHISYLMNPRTNMNIVLGLTQRQFKSNISTEPAASLIYIGFRTSIDNIYMDF